MTLSIRIAALIAATAILLSAQAPKLGRSEPNFSQPSLAPGVDYVLPSEAEIKATLDRIRDHFVRYTSYKLIDSQTNQEITDLSKPVANATIDRRGHPFLDWDYSMGVVLAAMFQVSDVTGDKTYEQYTYKDFDFVASHLDYFRAQQKQFGRARAFARLLNIRELDDCGAMGAALVKTQIRKPDPRFQPVIDVIADHILHKQKRLADGTLVRPRPQTTSLWADDAYMAIPFLAAMGKLTGERKYYDDAARQVIGFSAKLQDKNTGLYDHSWHENTPVDPKFYWGRGCGWVLVATADLLSVLPEDHPDRAKVLDIFQQAARGAVSVQSGNGMWHQLLDKTDSYLESSATAMFTFAIARGVNRGWLPVTYAPVAQTGWQALATQVTPEGQIDKICVGTTSAYDNVYYYNRPTDLNALQGYGATLMAGAEVISMLRNFRVDKMLNTFHYRVKQ